MVGNAPLATGQVGVTAIATDDFHVYFIVQSGEVRRVSIDGGKVETIAKGQPQPKAIALDASHVYWAAGDGTVAKVAKKGGAATTLAIGSAVRDIVVDDTTVYFTSGSTIRSVPKDVASASSSLLVDTHDNPHSLVLKSGLLFANGGDAAATGVSSTGGYVAELPVAGGSPVTLVADVAPHSLAAGTKHIAWTEFGEGLVRVAGLDGADLLELAQVDPKTEPLDSIVVDDAFVYFSTTAGVVRSVALVGGASAEVLLTGASGSVQLAVDATTLYVANSGDGAILALPKV